MLPDNITFDGDCYCEVDGVGYYRWKKFSAPMDCRLTITFVSTNSPHKQGIALGFPAKKDFKGKVFLNHHLLENPGWRTNLVIGEGDYSENRIILDIHMTRGYLCLSGASQTLGDYPEIAPGMAEIIFKRTGKTIEDLYALSWTSGFTAGALPGDGSAFWIEPLSSNRDRYHCNDHVMDDDFDDLIFDVEMEEIPALE